MTATRSISARAFGPHARAYAERVSPDLDLVLFDDAGYAEALDHALERSFLGGSFLAVPLIADRRAKIALDAAHAIVTEHAGYAQRRACLDLVRERRYAFAGKTQAEHEALTKKERDSMCDVLLAAGGVMVRSWTELGRIAELLDHRPVRALRAVAPPRISVPLFRPRRGAQTVVVWAPQLDAGRASLFAVALDELRVPVTIVCAGAADTHRLGFRATFIEATDAGALEDLLDRTAAIIDASVDDPASAIELAALNLPLGANFGSGAHEYIDGLYLYEAWDYRTILQAALAALGGEAPLLRAPVPRPDEARDAVQRMAPPQVENPPLVSVIVSTLNRHGILPRAIDSIARQTYPNVEAVVVNDGGKPVDELLTQLRRVTVLNNERPLGASHSQNLGFDAAKGEYIVFLSDDDYLFPTHLSRLVYALERTGGTIAGGMCADSYLTPGDPPHYDFFGVAIRPYRAVDPSVVRTIPHAMPAFTVVRRDAQVALGSWNPQAPVYDDYDRIMHFFKRYDCLWISHVVGNMDARLDRSNHSGRVMVDDRLADLTRIWADDPCPDRPDIGAARAALLTLFRDGAAPQLIPLHRGVTRIDLPKRSFYTLE